MLTHTGALTNTSQMLPAAVQQQGRGQVHKRPGYAEPLWPIPCPVQGSQEGAWLVGLARVAHSDSEASHPVKPLLLPGPLTTWLVHALQAAGKDANRTGSGSGRVGVLRRCSCVAHACARDAATAPFTGVELIAYAGGRMRRQQGRVRLHVLAHCQGPGPGSIRGGRAGGREAGHGHQLGG